MAGRNSQISRIFQQLLLLEGAAEGLSIKSLCDRLEARGFHQGKRTVYRDLQMLEGLGFAALVSDQKTDEGASIWKLGRHTRVTDTFFLSARELLALYLARNVLTPLKDTYFYEDLQSFFRKIEDRLPERSCRHLEEITGDFHFEPGPRWGLGIDPDIVETVRAACAERQLLQLTYFSAHSGDKRTRKLGPHFLYFAKGSLYLVAEDIESSTVKVFAVPRMSDVCMLDEIYQGTPTTPDQYFHGSFGVYEGKAPCRVSIKFTPKIAPYIQERRWHHSQTIVRNADHSAVLSLEVSLTPELVGWILGFGSQAEVISPLKLRQDILREATHIISTYQFKKAA